MANVDYNEHSFQKGQTLYPRKGNSIERNIVDIFVSTEVDTYDEVFVTYKNKHKKATIPMKEMVAWANRSECDVATQGNGNITHINTVKNTADIAEKENIMSASKSNETFDSIETYAKGIDLNHGPLIKPSDTPTNTMPSLARPLPNPITKPVVTEGSLVTVQKLMAAHFYKSEKVSLFIDNASTYSASRSIALDIDYKHLLALFKNTAQLMHANYYANMADDEEFTPLAPLTDFLSYNGYKVNLDYLEKNSQGRINSNVSVRIVTDMLIAAMSAKVDHIVLFAHSLSYVYTIEQLRRMGIRVTVISVLKNDTFSISSKLRQMADQFIDLGSLMPVISRIKA